MRVIISDCRQTQKNEFVDGLFLYLNSLNDVMVDACRMHGFSVPVATLLRGLPLRCIADKISKGIRSDHNPNTF